MLRSARARLVRSAAAALLAGALGVACSSSPPTDKNFGTNLGADFRAPNIDAGSDTNMTLEGGAAGQGGAAGAAGSGAAGSSGAAGAAGGTGGVRDAGGVEAGG
jgi:hypothetical protein